MIEPNWWEFPAVFLLVVTLAAADVWNWRAEETMNIVAPIWLSLALGITAAQMGLADGRAIWAPLFWFRVATIAYFGIGAIAPMFMNSTSQLYLDSFYIFMAVDIERVNLITALGVACVLGANLIFERVAGQASGRRIHELRTGNDAARIGVAMYLIGAAVNYYVFFSTLSGASLDVIPGFILNLSAFQLVGISLLTIWGLGNSSAAVLGVCVLVVIDCGMGLSTLTKTSALFPLLAFMIGFLSYRLTLSRLLAACLFMWVSYGLLIEPWVTFGRTEISIIHRNHTASTISERVEALSRYFYDEKKQGAPEGLQTGIIRMSYTNSAAFVIAQYDRGLPGNSLRDSLYSFIPRFLWPEKPQFKVAGELANSRHRHIWQRDQRGLFCRSILESQVGSVCPY